MRGLFGVLQLANFAAMDCLPVLFFCANARSFWGVAADELCSDGLPACYVFLRECAVFLGCCSWRTLQRWTACLVLCFFARMCGLFGVLQLANFAAMDCLPCFMFFCANVRSFWGVAAGELCSDGLLAFYYVFCANARSFWGVAAGEHCSNVLPNLFYVFLRECAILEQSSQHFGIVCCIALVIQ